MMDVQIVQLQQAMDFRTRKTRTFVLLALPNGKQVRLPVDEQAAAAIVEADIDVHGQAPVAEMDESSDVTPEVEDDVTDYGAPPEPTTVIEETPDLTVREFGGNGVPPPPKKQGTRKKQKTKAAAEQRAQQTAALAGPVVPPPPEEPKPQLPEGHVEPRSRKHYEQLVKEGKIQPNAFSKTVPKNEYGYPVIQPKEGTADPDAVVGQNNRDEDGVGSI
jgi:hypothetical protein